MRRWGFEHRHDAWYCVGCVPDAHCGVVLPTNQGLYGLRTRSCVLLYSNLVPCRCGTD